MIKLTNSIRCELTDLYHNGIRASNFYPDQVETLTGHLIIATPRQDLPDGGDFDMEHKLADMVGQYMRTADSDIVHDIMNYLVKNAIRHYTGTINELLTDVEQESVISNKYDHK